MTRANNPLLDIRRTFRSDLLVTTVTAYGLSLYRNLDTRSRERPRRLHVSLNDPPLLAQSKFLDPSSSGFYLHRWPHAMTIYIIH